MLVEVIEEQPAVKIGITKVLEDWTWECYEREHGKEATKTFHEVVDNIAAYVKKQGWDLPYNLNKYYTGFKLGNKVVFAIGWSGMHAWHISAKVSEEEARNFIGKNWEFQRYDNPFNQALFRPKSGKITDTSELENVLTLAYHRVSGTR